MLPTKLNRSREGSRKGSPRRISHCQRGFTLVELMVTLLIMGLIMSVVYKVFSSQDRFFRNQQQISAMQENLRATVEYINQELSWLGYQVPGIAVIKASPMEIIYQANIPNSGTTIQFVRYQFNPSTNTIWRAAGANMSALANSLTMMASDIEAVSFSYFNILNGVVSTSTSDPLCADQLTPLANVLCNLGTPDDDSSLLMVQRVKARVTARTSKPDWMYTDPEGGSNPNYRKRKAVLDLRARNVEDVTLQGGEIVVGSCGRLEHTITIPTPYAACADREYYRTNYRPDPANNTFDDNPYVTIQAFDMNDNLNTSPDQVTYVYAVADDGTPYNMYDSSDPNTVNNMIANGETRYLSARELSTVSTGTQVELQFAYSDGVCTQVSYEGNTPIIIAPNPASYFYSGGAFVNGGLSIDYVDNGGSSISLATPNKVAMCSSVGNERVFLGAQLLDDCQNSISGEIVAWSAGAVGGTFLSIGDSGGIYNATWVPPDTLPGVAPEYTGTLSAQWGSYNPTVNVTLIAAEPHDIVIDSIVDVSQAGIFQFASNVVPRATQLGGSSGGDFTIERIDGQEVKVTFHLEDACGNWVFESPSFNHSTSRGTVSNPLVNNGDGTHSFSWESDIGCGLEQLGETITISTSAIANPSTQIETVSFDMLTTRSSDPDSGPFVTMDVNPIGKDLQAGNTGDFVTVQATLQQYDPVQEYCTNLLAGSMQPFTMDFNLTGDTGGNGSFSASSPFNDVSESVATDVSGAADVNVYSGTADWDDSLTVTADVDVEGANFSGSIALGLKETNHPQNDSGFYQDSLYTTEIGSGQAITIFDPGDNLYLRIYDFDENEDPNAQDSFAFPYDVNVTVQSTLTQDIEVVGLTEALSGNSPNFIMPLPTTFYSAVATTVQKNDGTLLVRDGDTITMSYVDKDNPGDFENFSVNTPGADFFKIYRWDDPGETELINPGPTQAAVAYGDKLRPKLSLPFLAGDGSIDTDTVWITVDSGSDTDILVLKEVGDTGIMMPDDALYAGKHFSVAQSDLSDDDDILATPTTPRYVTLEYNVAGSYAMTLSFFMKDYDPPQVVINLPLDGATVSGLVTVEVDVSDVANPGGGISRVELYINGRLLQTIVGPDLTGGNTFTWTTAIGATAYWLDGSHVLTAKAYDISLNEATSGPVGVTVANNLSPIWFNTPAYNSIWSQDVDVQIQAGNLAAESGTHELLLFVNGSGSPAASFTVTGPGTFNHTVDTTLLPEGTADLIAIIRDIGTNEYQTTALDFIVDRTPPVINVGSPFDLPWINRAEFPLNVQATITDFKIAPADPNDVDDTTVSAAFSGGCSSGPLSMSEIPAGSDTYTLSWLLSSCDNVEGILTITVDAGDVASPANFASRAFSTRVDTKKPTVDTISVIPMVNQSFTMGTRTFDGFIKGDVTLQATVTDAYPQTGAFTAWYYNDPYVMAGPPDGTQYVPLENYQDASSGAFNDLWPTLSYSDGIYLLAAGVVDAAGNSNDSSPSKVLYLDNNSPWIMAPWINSMFSTIEPISGWWVPLVHGRINVNLEANDWSGFLKEVEHRYVQAGMNPGTAGTPTNVVHSVKYSFPVNDNQRFYSKSYTLDTCSLSPGAYDAHAYATDWAGNVSPIMGTNRFVIENFNYLVPPNAAAPVATFQEVPPVPKDKYILIGEGAIEDCNGPVDGLDVGLEFYRMTWDPFGMVYNWESPTHYTITTTVSGDFGPISAPQGAWTYESTHMAALVFDDPVTGDIFAVFHPLFLFNPQPYDSYGQYSPWHAEFEPFNQERLVTNLTYDLVPSIPLANTLTVAGSLIFNSGHPAVGESLIMELGWTDPMFGWMWTQYSTATDSSGAFTFTPPADISSADWFNVQFRHPSAYWGDDWLGNIDWDPLSGWRENLW